MMTQTIPASQFLFTQPALNNQDRVRIAMEREMRLSSTTPPTPRVPAGGAPIKVPNDNDVLSGRGGGVNSHPGNKRYRTIVNSMKTQYLSPQTRKAQKTQIAAGIVWTIRQSSPPGRFLKINPETGYWHEIGDKAAFRKTGQALRENSSEFRVGWRNLLVGDNVGAYDDTEKPSKKTGV